MDALIDLLITFLTNLRQADPISQFATLAGTPIVFLFGLPYVLTTIRSRSIVRAEQNLRGSLALTEAELLEARSQLTEERSKVSALEAATPQAFLKKHSAEMSEGNEERAMALADGFLTNQNEALKTAFRTRMKESIGNAVADGAAGYDAARRWGLCALALSPSDRALQLLIDNLDAAAGIANTGARVKLKGTNFETTVASHDRLPRDYDALSSAYFEARNRFDFALAEALADHGLIMTRRAPFGRESREHLMFRRHYAEAILYQNRPREARELLNSLVDEMKRLLPSDHIELFYAEHIAAEALLKQGDPEGAMGELTDLLARREAALGSGHSHVLSTIDRLAEIQGVLGDSEGAIRTLKKKMDRQHKEKSADAEIANTRMNIALHLSSTEKKYEALQMMIELLPVQEKHLGKDNPIVFYLRMQIAVCRLLLGKNEVAIHELSELLTVQEAVLGEKHLQTLENRLNLSKAYMQSGENELAKESLIGVRTALERHGLMPQHRLLTFMKMQEELLSQSN